ncbi:fumarylacetoacetase [Tsukamurella serpentis]
MSSAADKYSAHGFGVANLPYASVTADDRTYLATRLGDRVIDIAALAERIPGLDEVTTCAVSSPNLDELLAAGVEHWDRLRRWLIESVSGQWSAIPVEAASVPVAAVAYNMPFTPADYVDYYASEDHASNIGRMFRPDEAPLKPNWKHLPVGYHGRSGTVVASGTDIVRPKGLLPRPGGIPEFGASERLDIEAEMGFVCGGAPRRHEVTVSEAPQYIFGAFLFNDWSARDIQNFEYVPLGPNLGKSFASTVGAWVVPFAALHSARVDPPRREFPIADYLADGAQAGGPWGLDITLEVDLDGEIVSRPEYRSMYWTPPQMLSHMTINGASLRPGDMFGSGTISGPQPSTRGSFMELSWGGREPLTLRNGAEMTFLQDGQTVTLRALAPGAGGESISFGECAGTILPATGH